MTADRPREMYRLPARGKVAGVCAGIAEYFRLPVWPVRLAFVALTLMFVGTGIMAYAIGWFLLEPDEPVALGGVRGKLDGFFSDARQRWEGRGNGVHRRHHGRAEAPSDFAAFGDAGFAEAEQASDAEVVYERTGPRHEGPSGQNGTARGRAAPAQDWCPTADELERAFSDIEHSVRDMERFVTDQQFQLRAAFRNLG